MFRSRLCHLAGAFFPQTLANSSRGSEVSRIELLMSEAGHCFGEFVLPPEVTPAARAASGGPCSLPWPASAVVHPFWVVPNQLRLCIQLYRMANRMLNAYESPILMSWLTSSNVILNRVVTYPPACEVYHQLFRLQTALIRVYDGKLLPFLERTVHVFVELSQHLIAQGRVVSVTSPAAAEDAADDDVDKVLERPRKQAKAVREVRVIRVPRVGLWMRGAITSLLFAVREFADVLKREVAAADLLLGPAATPTSHGYPALSSPAVADAAVVGGGPSPTGFLLCSPQSLSTSRPQPVFRVPAPAGTPPFVLALRRVFANAVSFGADVYCAACACISGLSSMELPPEDARFVASGLYHAMVAPLVYRTLPAIAHLTEIVEAVKVPNTQVDRCLVEAVLDIVVDDKCLGRPLQGMRSQSWFDAEFAASKPCSDVRVLLAGKASQLHSDSAAAFDAFVQPSAGPDTSMYRAFRAFCCDTLDAAAIQLACSDDSAVELYHCNAEYGLLWEMYGVGSGGGAYNDKTWRSWIADPSLGTAGFGLARLDCSTPIVDIVTARLTALAEVTEQLTEAGCRFSAPVSLVGPPDSELCDDLERLLCTGYGDLFAMLWQAVKNTCTVTKVGVISAPLLLCSPDPAFFNLFLMPRRRSLHRWRPAC